MYFVIGNVWLIVGLVLKLGQKEMFAKPTMYSFFGSGAWFEPNTYDRFVAFAFGAAAVSFVLAFRNRKKAV